MPSYRIDPTQPTTSLTFATAQALGRYLVPGDTVTFAPGQHAGFTFGYDTSGVYGPISGTKDARIAFRCEPGAIVGRDSKTLDAINLERCNWLSFDGFTTQGQGRAGYRWSHCEGITWTSCTAVNCNEWAFFSSFSKAVVVLNCTGVGSRKQHGLYASNSPEDWTIQGCNFAGNAACGIHVNGDASQGGAGVATGFTITGNTLSRNGLYAGSGAAINCDGLLNSLISDNTLTGNLGRGIAIFRQDAAMASLGNTLDGNLIRMPASARYGIQLYDGATSTILRNNVVIGSTKCGAVSASADSLSRLTGTGNVYRGKFSVDGGATIIDLAKWQTVTGADLLAVAI